MHDRPTSPWLPADPAAPDPAQAPVAEGPPANPWVPAGASPPAVEATPEAEVAPSQVAPDAEVVPEPEAEVPAASEAAPEVPAEAESVPELVEIPEAESVPELVEIPEALPAGEVPPPSWAPAPARSRGGRGAGVLTALRRELLIPVWLTALGAVALVSAAVACVVLAGQDDTPRAATGAATSSPTGLEASSPRLRTVRDPFELDGVRWAVFVAPSQDWTRFAKRILPGPGKRWVLISVRVRNLSRGDGFVPNGLGYRLADDSGSEYTADPGHSTDGAAGPAVPPNGLGQVQLTFKVPATASGLTLRYATRVPGGTAVGVPIGAG